MKTSIGKKLLLGFLSILIILIAVISLNFYQLAKVQHTYDDLIDDKVAKLIKIKELHVSIEAEQNAVRGYVATKNDVEIQKFTDAHETYQHLSSELNKIIKKNEALAILQEIDQIESDYFELGNKEIEVTRQNKQVEFEDMVARGGQTIEQFNQKIGELTSYQQKLLDNGHQETAKTVAQIKQTMLSLGILAILLGIAVALFMGRLISRPLVSMAKAAKKIANGDLTEKAIDVKSKDEIGQLAASFNQMSHNLRQLLQQIELNAEHVAASSEELTASADQSSKASEQITITMQELAQGIEKEVQSIEETSRTMNEISMSVQQIAASAQNVSASSMDTSEKASDGGKVIYNAIEQMNSINQTVQLLAESIKSLGERSNEIGNITSVISEISAQTNLLALNAAIEAARAGEHGRGFAVVAGEVGKLAALSAQSAEQISALITSIQEETEKSILSMEGAVKEVSSGIKIAHDAGDSFTHIEGSINEVTMQIQEISAAVQQLAAGSEQIVQSMEFVKRIAEEAAAGTQEVSASTEEQLASMEEISASAHSLSKMAEELQKTIGQFNI